MNFIKNFGTSEFLVNLSKKIPVWKQIITPSIDIDWGNSLAYVSDLSNIKSYSYGGVRINRKTKNFEYLLDGNNVDITEFNVKIKIKDVLQQTDIATKKIIINRGSKDDEDDDNGNIDSNSYLNTNTNVNLHTNTNTNTLIISSTSLPTNAPSVNQGGTTALVDTQPEDEKICNGQG